MVEPSSNQVVCPRCGVNPDASATYRQYRVCASCRYHFQMSARARIELLADEGSFSETNPRLASLDPLHFSDKQPYAERLSEARERTGLSEAVVTGTARIAGLGVVLAVSDFAFMGGTM